jgi:hypothetical protein
MLSSGIIRNDFINRRILIDRMPAIIIIVVSILLVYYFLPNYLITAGILALLLILIDLPSLLRRYRHHRQLMEWLKSHRRAVIFAYSTKVRYLELIQKQILPNLSNRVLVVKMIGGHARGDIEKYIWFELARQAKIRQLPVIISTAYPQQAS